MITRSKVWWLDKARLEGDSDVSVGSAGKSFYGVATALIDACDATVVQLAVMPVYADLFARHCPGVGWCWPCKGLLYMATDELLPCDVVETIRSMRET